MRCPGCKTLLTANTIDRCPVCACGRGVGIDALLWVGLALVGVAVAVRAMLGV